MTGQGGLHQILRNYLYPNPQTMFLRVKNHLIITFNNSNKINNNKKLNFNLISNHNSHKFWLNQIIELEGDKYKLII